MTSRDTPATLRRTYPARRVADHLLTHPAGDYVSAIADATGLSPRILRGPNGVLRRLVDAGYATREVEQADPAELRRPQRTYYRLTDAGRLWAAAAHLVVWRRIINLQEAEAPVTVSIVYLPVGGGDTQGEEAWRVELSGNLSQQLTAGDASNLALLLDAAAEEVAATGQPPASDRDHQWMRAWRPGTGGYRPAGRREHPGARDGRVGRRSESRPRAPVPQMDLGSGSSDAVTVNPP